jgi:hypothetical protein
MRVTVTSRSRSLDSATDIGAVTPRYLGAHFQRAVGYYENAKADPSVEVLVIIVGEKVELSTSWSWFKLRKLHTGNEVQYGRRTRQLL